MMYDKKPKVVLSSSGGKDSIFSFYLLRESGYEVALLTTLSETGDIHIHHFDKALLEVQAEALKAELCEVIIPKGSGMEGFLSNTRKALSELQKKGFEYAAYGDIFLEDVRKFREEQLLISGITNIFPLWKKPSEQIATEFISKGFKAIILGVNSNLIAKEWVGRDYDDDFLNYLKINNQSKRKVDLCGEYGEFHTFVYDGPCFKFPIQCSLDFENPITYFDPDTKDSFYFCKAYYKAIPSYSLICNKCFKL